MINIRNAKKGLELKIKKCLALLDEEYTALNYTIYFYENRGKFLKEQTGKADMQEKQYEQILNGKIEAAGITIGEKRIIKIFLFLFGDLKRDPKEILNVIATLFHEIRHAWQNENNLFQNEEEISTIDGNFESYLRLPSEKDAYRFQEAQMQEHAESILEIFGFNLKCKYILNSEIRDVIYS
ncbi:hypothetical protein [Viridibacillus arvi]|uniref:hypothetical protein n=1 Tax=Viridibacillus arvi TaxID=263475 RepID=UPI003D270A57